ncbi:tape measure protein [Moraxella sp. 7664LN]|uniref:tape measure protein n=1 Tax=Moraxella sp. 7664LN TaxID=3093635 RepID=UPI002B407281|nr:tape measure protein [Moraxella sp. 7664LN]
MSLNINIVLGADTVNFTRSIKQVNIQTQKAMTDIQNNVNRASIATEGLVSKFQGMEKKSKISLTNVVTGLSLVTGAVTVAGYAFSNLTGIIETQRQFDVLNASLITATGSAHAAAEKMKELNDFASKTPYDLNQAVDGFNKLKNLGLDPSVASLNSFGNTAAAMGKDLNQMIEAVADASTGEFERLKEFGIKAKKQGSDVEFTFQGVTTKVKNNSQDIQKYLTDIGNVQFATAMAERMNTLDGAISMLAGSWGSLQLAIMNTKVGNISLLDVLKSGAKAATTAIDWVANNLQHIANVLGVVFAPALTMMAARFLSAKLSVDSLTGSMLANIRTSIANATSTQQLGNVLMAWASGTTSAQMAMHRYSLAINQATASVMGFVRAMPAKTAALGTATAAAVAKTRATLSLAAAQRALIATSVTAARGVMGIGTAFAALGRIILAHPITTIAAVISAVIVRTMGLQKAMDSLSDAVNLVGSMLGDLVDIGINGFKWLGGKIDKFFSSFASGGGQSTGVVSGYFSELFAGTEGGFVGLIQVIARLLDRMINFFGRAIHSVRVAFANLWNGIAKGAQRAFKAVGLDGVINATVEMPKDYQPKNVVENYVNGLVAKQKANKKLTKSQDDLNKAVGKGIKDTNKLSGTQKNAAAATNEVDEAIGKLKKDIALFGKDDPLSALQYDIDKGKYTGVSPKKLQQLKTLTEQFYTLQKNESVKDKMLAIDEKIYSLGKSELDVLKYQLDHAKEYNGVSKEIKQSYLERTKALLEAQKAHERIKKIEESKKSLNKAKYELKHFGDEMAGTRWDLKEQGYDDEEIGKIVGHEQAKKQIEKLNTLFEQIKQNQVFGGVGITARIDQAFGGLDFASQMLGQSFDITKKFKEEKDRLNQAREQGLIDEQTYLKQSEELTKAHVQAKEKLMFTANQSILGGITNTMKKVYGEQSKHYKIAFAMEKAYSVATIIMKQKEAIAKAWASAPFPANLGAVASTLASTGALAAAVNAIRPVGQAHDGIMSVPKSGTWNLEKGERVLPKHTAQNLDNTLNRLQGNGGGQVINISVTVNNDGGDVQSSHDMGKSLGNAIKLAVQSELQKERRQGGLLYGR